MLQWFLRWSDQHSQRDDPDRDDSEHGTQDGKLKSQSYPNTAWFVQAKKLGCELESRSVLATMNIDR